MENYMKNLAVMVLAAGKSTRMKSEKSKLLHPVLGVSIIGRLSKEIKKLNCKKTVFVVGFQKDEVVKEVKKTISDIISVDQGDPKGTGHAVQKGINPISGFDGNLLIVGGDVPLLTGETLEKLISEHNRLKNNISFLTFIPQNPFGYGRVIRDENSKILEIKEQVDLDENDKKVLECNSGIYVFDSKWVQKSIGSLKTDNNQGEFYLTDLIKLASRDGDIYGMVVSEDEVMGVNTRYQLNIAETIAQNRVVKSLMESGVTIKTPVVIEECVVIENDVVIERDVNLCGETSIKSGTIIKQGSILTNVEVHNDCLIKPYSVITDSFIGEAAQIGPFAHLRPGSIVGKKAKVGNFVETKKTILHEGVKASHLTYLGDTEIGKGSNIGAGTITCNYDGVNKFKTTLGENVFVGSDSQLIAPVNIGDNVYIGTGTTVLKDVPSNSLVINPKKQKVISPWEPPVKTSAKPPVKKVK
jgi:bifunctional UDP-N-acetylglucosamine pyrophosphorylase / glucosamine-1-phosphate N-acetyltransferase